MRVLLAFFGATAIASTAAATTKSECVDANTQGQLLRKEEKLHAARASFQTCSDPKCPTVVRADCQTRIEEIAQAMPTVVFDETDTPQGPVTITMDGETLAFTGTPIEVDPGEHHFVFRSGTRTITHTISIDENEKPRHVQYAFEEKPVVVPPVGNPTLRFAGIGLAAAGLVGLGLGVGFGVASYGAWASVKNECASTSSACDYAKATSDRQSALDFAHGSDIAFAIGGALVVTGAVLFGLGARVTAVVTPRVIGFTLREEF